jgi:hypothetical protein
MKNQELILEELLHIRIALDKIKEHTVEINKILTRMEKHTQEFDEIMRERRLKWIKQNV